MSRVTRFEINADDPEKLLDFYSQTLGWTSQRAPGPNDYFLVSTGDGEQGIDGAVMRAEQSALPSARVINTAQVTSIDAVLEKVEQAGGNVALGKTEIPGIGWVAYCSDPEGNAFGLLQPAG